MKYLIILSLLLMTACTNCNVQEGDFIKHKALEIKGMVLLINGRRSLSSACSGRVITEHNQILGDEMFADWERIQ